jgi:hypothetical protein
MKLCKEVPWRDLEHGETEGGGKALPDHGSHGLTQISHDTG